jgi:hypothetical protein
MMLVYSLPATEAIYQRFVGIDGSAYFVGGLGMTALTASNIVVSSWPSSLRMTTEFVPNMAPTRVCVKCNA